MTLTGYSATQSVQVEALGVVGPRLSKECRERDLSVTDKAAAEIFVSASWTGEISVHICHGQAIAKLRILWNGHHSIHREQGAFI